MAADTITLIEELGTRHETVVDGLRLIWRRFGTGPSLVLLHGGHGSWLHWVRNIPQMSSQRTVWVPDMPGFGESGDFEFSGSSDERMEQLVAAIVTSMDVLGLTSQPFDLAAFSFGGLVAVRLAKRGLVRRMALIAPGGHGGAKPAQEPLHKWRLDDLAASKAALRHNLAAFMLYECDIDESAFEIYELQCRATRTKGRDMIRRGELRQALVEIDVPLLLLWGANDVTATPREIAPQLAALGPDTAWHVIECAGHWVQYERADSVNALLSEWFD